MYYSGLDGSGIVPNWACIVTAVMYIIYHLLDCCDGKQARRIKAGSPLGFIMDHNLDSFSLVLLTIAFINIFRWKSPIHIFMTYAVASIPFFIATLEEYHTGIMDLPRINGVDEGMYLLSSLFLFTGYVGSMFWEENKFYGFSYGLIILYVLGIICSCFTLMR